jgi:mannosylglycerate hydrolase
MTPKEKAPISAHYISGTHWDREWYRPWQEFRVLLVELMDGLLDLLERNPDFKYFHLDAQTCVLNDYAEVRPENRERLAAFIRAGRVLVGPWYTMPDLFCPSDEALVHNLLMGRRVCADWGVDPMPVAYTCDMFGHPSQMPQIYKGFDLADCVLGRGSNEHTTPAFFNWEAPDGSAVFCFKLDDRDGYAAFVGARRILEPDDGKPAPDAETKTKDFFKDLVGREVKRSKIPVLCMIDALDHMLPAVNAARYLRLLHEACPDVAPVHSTLPAFFAEAHARIPKAPSRRGELREPSKRVRHYNWLIPNCVSSRVRMKQANDTSQMLLEKWAEPLVAIANVEGAALPERYLRIAWEHVVASHAHDSICGCSIDQVHRDMMYRFDQTRILARQLRAKAFGALTAGCRDLAKADGEFTVAVFNPVPARRREVLVFDLHFPKDYATRFREDFGSQEVLAFSLEDEAGRPVPYQRLGIAPHQYERSTFARHAFAADGDFYCYTIAAELELPPLGFSSLRVVPSEVPVRCMTSLRTGPTSAENEHLVLEIAPNGTIVVTDKATGEVYGDLLTFEDRSEIGDGWFHVHAVTDEAALSSACPAQVSFVHDGPEVVTFRVAVTMNVPKRFDWLHEHRTEERTDLVVTSTVSLRRGARTVEVETVVENNAEDHRLRLLLPTDTGDAKTYLAHHPYDLVERAIALDPETASGQEADLAEKPFLGLQAVGAGTRGLAFLSAGGLHEGGVADDRRRTMLVTLLRSFRRTAGTPGEPDGLEQGRITYRYALMPFAGTLPRVEALKALAALQAGLFTRQTGKTSSGFPAMAGQAAPTQSYLECTQGKLIVSAVKPAEAGGGFVVRLWNPDGRKVSETLTFWKKVKSAKRLKLSEEPSKGPAPTVKDRTVALEAKPHEIVTIGVVFQPSVTTRRTRQGG